jgi:hypothetical protein
MFAQLNICMEIFLFIANDLDPVSDVHIRPYPDTHHWVKILCTGGPSFRYIYPSYLWMV